ncbi:hypothetical protein Misp01_44070 [Microtetraspora sp. NBRC 13810]|uniref:DUF5947 family protein n=1 Tax=Microtetraspora sp. NBRC 13810 TaxID=3030990 RepID=UPI0024A33721|nr:DUF5947 family protein [Microtetraspora sp. NBRC 13810]GLW09278.1 hypothetical protein Misp01_44070 [Microtetraspora sp. NBRC 13810]
MSERRAGGGLRAILDRPAGPPAGGGPGGEPAHRCELCAAPIAEEHRHLVEPGVREPRCACRPCALLFDRPPAAGDRYRLVPDRRWHLPGFALDDATWAALNIPVRMAFAYRDSAADRTVVLYPSPAGAVEAPVDGRTWAAVEAANPVLTRLAPDVEALLIDRTDGARDHWLVPIDDCYALVALLRTRWQGLAGGADVWRAVAGFFAGLRHRARPMPIGEQKGVPR